MLYVSLFRFSSLFVLFFSLCNLAGCISSSPSLAFPLTSTSEPTPIISKTLMPTSTSAFAAELRPTNTPGSFAVFQASPPREGEICGEYTPVPQMGWVGYPIDFEPAAYVRAYALQESISLNLVVVEWGTFVKPSELMKINGKTIYSYDGQRPLFAYSAIALENAPRDIQEKLQNGATIAGLEIVDTQNNSLPYSISDQSIKDINYVVDDSSPHPLLDIALSCPGSIDDHPINYAPLQTKP